FLFFFFSSRRRHTRFSRDWSSDVCSSDLDSVVEVRDRHTIFLDRIHQFDNFMDEGMLITDRVTWWPPCFRVSMCRICCEHTAEALYIWIIIVEINHQLIHSLKIKDDTTFTTIDLERIRATVTGSIACSFKAT